MIIDVQLQEVGIPTKAYVSVEEVLEVRLGIKNEATKIIQKKTQICLFFCLQNQILT